ncbi:MAG: 16S rRNA (adenine(1518)-N(6)/adenine(1519)-N(6))-dimethyltransferase RsmA [Elusimicrobiota bacterium]
MKFDQHFLIDGETADRIVSAAALRPGESVLEIGPGKGVLTERLLASGARVRAVEIDRSLAAALRERFGPAGLEVVEADFLRADPAALGTPDAVVSNLPYSVGTHMLRRLFVWPVWRRAVLMFQKEVARRVLAQPGGKGYGLLALSTLIHADAEPVCDAPRACFQPPPKVDSAVVLLFRREKPRLPEGVGEEGFFRVARAAFSQKRKMAAKSIASALGVPKEEVWAALEGCGVPRSARAEEIGPEAFSALARSLRGFDKI